MLITLPFRFPGVTGVQAAFQTRLGAADNQANISLEAGAKAGAEADADKAQTIANRQALAQTHGLRGLAEVKQVHGVRTLFEPEAQDLATAPMLEADGLACRHSPEHTRLGLMIKTADCQPILLAHKGGKHIMALHVGWKGNCQRYPQIAVAEFCARYQLLPSDLLAVRGPSLGPAAAEFIHFDREWGPEFSAWYKPATRTMNLWELARAQLMEAGLPKEHIFSLDFCTWTLPEAFFSYRRDHACGRQASLIWFE
jgi:YfiH family protein